VSESADKSQDEVDANVYALLQAEDPNAARVLIDVFGDRVYGLCLRILSSEEDAQEVAQETFLTIWNKWPTFKKKSKFSSWIYRIAANHAYMRLRKRKRRANDVSLDSGEPEGDRGYIERSLVKSMRGGSAAPDTLLEKQEIRGLLSQAIGNLSPTYRTAYVLKDIDGLSLKEIAEIMDLSESAVKSRVHRARLAIRKKLELYMSK
jgi:RNA polymerase sigma-70 factor (ECF subfamily)